MASTTIRCPADQAKDALDALIRLARSHAGDRDPVKGICDQLLEMRHALTGEADA